ncbi:methyl-accepting chemotaxis protein II [Duganella sp. HH101]|nr:methyl-accepting chemotaxis protein II [Duganella sp. HH101]
MKITDMKIGVRLGGGFAIVLALLIAIAGQAVYSLSKSNDALHHIVDVNMKKIELIEEMSTSIHIVGRVTRTIALLSDDAEADSQHQKIDTARVRFDAAYGELAKMPLDDAGTALLGRIKTELATVRAANNRFALLLKSDRDEAIALLLKEAIPATTRLQNTLDEFDKLQQHKSSQDETAASELYASTLAYMLGLVAAAVAIGVLTALATTRSITGPLGRAVKLARTVAAGDLTGDIQIESSDETGQLLQALKEMNDSLLNIVGKVRSGTDTIAAASTEIANGNLDLSSRTEQQASALEETASAMEELTSTVKQNADNARQANQLAISASDTANKGGKVVAAVVQTMAGINDSSKKIVDIISVIDGIAFQTNILALNAAVEAARAGEQGRGFAVVATEVRNLAQRSAAAAKEIKTLIHDSVDKVGSGTRQVEEAGSAMQAIVQSIQSVADVIGEISAASQEQTSGIEQINDAVMQMDQVTQQNAALVEEAAAAAASLQEQASHLAAAVSVFKTDAARAHAIPKPQRIPAKRTMALQLQLGT